MVPDLVIAERYAHAVAWCTEKGISGEKAVTWRRADIHLRGMRRPVVVVLQPVESMDAATLEKEIVSRGGTLIYD